ncbi:MAG: UDP-glucose/GDP-mannose dehydrogenase family protein, partial [Candidatus Neomarinimicrobiota bacterium]
DLDYKQNVYEAIKGADALILMTEWNEFRSLDLKRVKTLLRQPVFIDTRNIYDPCDMREKGFIFVCTGRSNCDE